MVNTLFVLGVVDVAAQVNIAVVEQPQSTSKRGLNSAVGHGNVNEQRLKPTKRDHTPAAERSSSALSPCAVQRPRGSKIEVAQPFGASASQ